MIAPRKPGAPIRRANGAWKGLYAGQGWTIAAGYRKSEKEAAALK